MEGEIVRLLDESDALAGAFDPSVAVSARRDILARVERLDPGPWTPATIDRPHEWLGLFVLDGLLARDVAPLGISCTELLGAGDLLRPWDHDGREAPVSSSVTWEVLQSTRIALLDRRFVTTGARWPELVTALASSALQRSRWLSVQLAVRCLSGVDLRLLVVLWHLADRWGRVKRDGVVLPIVLTHAQLGRLIAAQRASVTRGLARLRAKGFVSRLEDGGWLLRPEALELLPDLARRSADKPSEAGVLERLCKPP